MCSYVTERATVTGSAKGASGWFPLTHATVYFDHPYHSPYDHTLNIDFANSDQGPSSRVAVELTASSASWSHGSRRLSKPRGQRRAQQRGLQRGLRRVESRHRTSPPRDAPEGRCDFDRAALHAPRSVRVHT